MADFSSYQILEVMDFTVFRRCKSFTVKFQLVGGVDQIVAATPETFVIAADLGIVKINNSKVFFVDSAGGLLGNRKVHEIGQLDVDKLLK